MNDDSDPIDDGSAELDGLRIRQVAALRCAAYRSRSHAIIAMLVCVVALIQSIISLIQHLRHQSFNWRIPFYCVIILLSFWGIIFFRRRAIELHREATEKRHAPPSANPDFSTLSDGSQRWKDLEKL